MFDIYCANGVLSHWTFPSTCYTNPARRELDTLKSTFLIDEEERPLKSLKNYQEALLHTVRECPQLVEYMKSNIVFTTGDWPTWYFEKKLIAQVLNHHNKRQTQ